VGTTVLTVLAFLTGWLIVIATLERWFVDSRA
jgi:hypothetical protein